MDLDEFLQFKGWRQRKMVRQLSWMGFVVQSVHVPKLPQAFHGAPFGGSLSSEKLFLSLTEFPQKPQWIVEPHDHRKKQTRFWGLNTAQMGYPTHGSIDGIPTIHIQ